MSLGLEPAISLIPVIQHFLCTSQHCSEASDAWKYWEKYDCWPIEKHTLALCCLGDGTLSALLSVWESRPPDVSRLLCSPEATTRWPPLPPIWGDASAELVAGVARLLCGRKETFLIPHCCLTRCTLRCRPTSTIKFQKHIKVHATDSERTRYDIIFHELDWIPVVDIPRNVDRFTALWVSQVKSQRVKANIEIKSSIEGVEKISKCYMLTGTKTCGLCEKKSKVYTIDSYLI
jgi:hypothetical protein